MAFREAESKLLPQHGIQQPPVRYFSSSTRLRVLDGSLKWCYECQHTVIPDLVKQLWASCETVTPFAELLTDYNEGWIQAILHRTLSLVGARIAKLRQTAKPALPAAPRDRVPWSISRCVCKPKNWRVQDSLNAGEVEGGTHPAGGSEAKGGGDRWNDFGVIWYILVRCVVHGLVVNWNGS